VGTFLLAGHLAPFASLSLPNRIKVLNGWAGSSISMKRKVFRALKTLTCGLLFTKLDENHRCPLWEAIGYPGPDPAFKDSGKSFYRFKIEDHAKLPDTLECDAVIVGSGAGGGVVAGELAKAGYKVIVLEKGVWIPQGELTQVEKDSFERMYENGSIASTEDTGINIFAGSTFGGGTTVLDSIPFFSLYYVPSPTLAID